MENLKEKKKDFIFSKFDFCFSLKLKNFFGQKSFWILFLNNL